MQFQDSLAANLGILKDDRILQINQKSTQNLTNEQLRNIMKERLLLNSIELLIARAIDPSGTWSLRPTSHVKPTNCSQLIAVFVSICGFEDLKEQTIAENENEIDPDEIHTTTAYSEVKLLAPISSSHSVNDASYLLESVSQPVKLNTNPSYSSILDSVYAPKPYKKPTINTAKVLTTQVKSVCPSAPLQ
jgi:hypothetical protein